MSVYVCVRGRACVCPRARVVLVGEGGVVPLQLLLSVRPLLVLRLAALVVLAALRLGARDVVLLLAVLALLFLLLLLLAAVLVLVRLRGEGAVLFCILLRSLSLFFKQCSPLASGAKAVHILHNNSLYE